MSRRVQRGFQRERFTEAVRYTVMTIGDLGRLSDVSPATIRAWLRGGYPDIERLARVAATLNLELPYLIDVPDTECLPSDLRLRKGLTQVQLAAAVGLSTTVVSGFERAETAWDEGKTAAIAAVLGVSPDILRQAWNRARNRAPGTPA